MKENQIKIYVVDDDLFSAEVYNQFLKNIGYYNTYYFSNGFDCIKNLNENPNIIFLDNDIEDASHFKILKEIKSINPSIYVVVLSSDKSMKTKSDAYQFGAFDFLLKDENTCTKMANRISNILKITEDLKKSI
jgi:DNA-binding NtrC family response regulator